MATRKKKPAPNNSIKNRIVGHGEESPEQILANPKNWRIHPKFQRDALKDVLDEVGWVDEVIINKRTGTLIDGHLRVDIGIEDGEETLPVSYIDVSEQEEDIILATIDPIANMAVADPDKLRDLIENAQPKSERVQELLHNVAFSAGVELGPPTNPNDISNAENFEDIPAELPGAHALKPDMLFQSDAPYGIPELKPELIPEVPDDFRTWPGRDLVDKGIYDDEGDAYLWMVGTTPRGVPFDKSYLAFYSEDHKFESVWLYPDEWAGRILNSGTAGAFTPDFSIWWEQPMAYHFYQYYRNAWCARYFQESGIPVIPSFSVGPNESYREVQVAGIPKGAKTVSFQAQTSLRIATEDVIRRAVRGVGWALEDIQPETVVVYASRYGKEVYSETVESGPWRVLWLESVMDVRRDHIQDKSDKGPWRKRRD